MVVDEAIQTGFVLPRKGRLADPDNYPFYEELRTLIEAVKRLGLGKDAVEKVMYSNAAALLR